DWNCSMSYISDNLIPNEQVLYRTRLHWKIFVPAVLVLFLCLPVIVVAIDGGLNPYLSLSLLVVPLVAVLSAYLTWLFSEFGVTDKRVLVKTGIVGGHTLDTLLTRVENIVEEQSLGGRLSGWSRACGVGCSGTGRSMAQVLGRPRRRSLALMRHWNSANRLKRLLWRLRNGARVRARYRNRAGPQPHALSRAFESLHERAPMYH